LLCLARIRIGQDRPAERPGQEIVTIAPARFEAAAGRVEALSGETTGSPGRSFFSTVASMF
jgi:hypothetical protein